MQKLYDIKNKEVLDFIREKYPIRHVVYPSEIIEYCCNEKGVTREYIVNQIRGRFKNDNELWKFLHFVPK
jgi:hypothetical protein